MKINTKKTKATPFKFGEENSNVEFNVRPTAFSNFVWEDTGKQIKSQFMNSLTGWSGLEDEDGKEFKYSEKNKEYLYDYFEDVRTFVLEKSRELNSNEAEEIKN